MLGGDYVTFGDRQFVGPVAELLAPLAYAPPAPSPCWATTTTIATCRPLSRSGASRCCKDQRTSLTIRGETVDLAGLRFWTRRPSDLARVLAGTSGTTILLAHDPRRLREAAALDVQLVLSGHTHGGQVVLPGVGAVAGRQFPVLAGDGSEGNATMFVSRGVGTVYVPVRINCPPEVAVLTLRSARQQRLDSRLPPVNAEQRGTGARRCCQPPASTSADRLGIQPVLLDQDARRQRLAGVGREAPAPPPAATIGPASSSAVTRWTVQPATLTPCSSACRCASTPGNAGSSDGWTLSTAFGNASTNSEPSSRMNPARQTSSTS